MSIPLSLAAMQIIRALKFYLPFVRCYPYSRPLRDDSIDYLGASQGYEMMILQRHELPSAAGPYKESARRFAREDEIL